VIAEFAVLLVAEANERVVEDALKLEARLLVGFD
jgi:hypothetical protein